MEKAADGYVPFFIVTVVTVSDILVQSSSYCLLKPGMQLLGGDVIMYSSCRDFKVVAYVCAQCGI